jgi:predicted nucleic acid-binding protein
LRRGPAGDASPRFSRAVEQIRASISSKHLKPSLTKGWHYHQRPDKLWSLTDCTSFAVVRARGISEALTGDHHFEQAGFVAMMK